MSTKASKNYNLQLFNPTLALEWHPTRNAPLTPADVTPGSNKKTWWLCRKGHEWPATICDRTRGYGCRFCTGRAPCQDNCLQTINPVLALEWHPTKNIPLTPAAVTPGSGKKAWWLCKKGHEWQAIIEDRTAGTGCPFCHSKTSMIELRIYSEMKHLFSDILHRDKIHGTECDVYIPQLKFGIEIDGLYWHKTIADRHFKDQEKTELLKRNGVLLLRLREKGLSKISEHDIIFLNKDTGLTLTKKVVRVILKRIKVEQDVKKSLKLYLKRDCEANEKEFLELLKLLPSPLPGDSLADKNPSLAQEWHPTLNGSLTPIDVFPGAGAKAWWLCRKGHEWPATINHRTSGRGCPYCVGRAPCQDNCLQTLYPAISLEWHPSRNGILTPADVTPGSHKKVWWRCKKNHDHEWQAIIYPRTHGNGCHRCYIESRLRQQTSLPA